jgi:hypothetical protein
MLRLSTIKLLGINLSCLLAFDAISNEIKSAPPEATIEEKTLVQKTIVAPSPASFRTLQWDDLIPEEDLNALLNPPNYIDQLDDSALEDQISDQLQIDLTPAADDPYQQALVSTRIIQEMDGLAVKIPGFVVPVEFDEETITEFFLVPYFGACIHSPPPPPNQIIYVHAPKGLELNTLYDPFWISGIITTSLVKNYMASAAYSMTMNSYEPYTE